MIEGLPISTITLVINVLGLPGMIFVIWYVDQKRLDKMMKRYDADMARVVRMYEDNVLLVKGYEKLAGDLTGIITLNTQVQTNLVNAVKNNLFCPITRKQQGSE